MAGCSYRWLCQIHPRNTKGPGQARGGNLRKPRGTPHPIRQRVGGARRHQSSACVPRGRFWGGIVWVLRLDLTLLFCGVCESYNLLCFVVVTGDLHRGPYHTYAAVELNYGLDDWGAFGRRWPTFEQSPVIDDSIWFHGRFPGVCMAIECTGFAAAENDQCDPNMPEGPGRDSWGHLAFADSCAAGARQAHVQGRDFRFAIDIGSARMLWRLPSYPIDLPAPPSRDCGVLPLLSNRESQVEAIKRAVNADGRRPQLFIVPGNLAERHDALIERLRRFDLPACMGYREDIEFIPPDWDLPPPPLERPALSALNRMLGAVAAFAGISV